MIFYKVTVFVISHLLFVDWGFQAFCMLWKTYPLLFENREIIENTKWWKNGRELLNKLRKDTPYWIYLRAVELFIAV